MRLLALAGINMVRCWGGAGVQQQALYQVSKCCVVLCCCDCCCDEDDDDDAGSSSP